MVMDNADPLTRDDAVRGSSSDFDERYRVFHPPLSPVSWWEYHGGCWMVAGYEETAAVARDPETFSSRHDLPNGSTPYVGAMIPPMPVRGVPSEVDPADCLAYRRLLSRRLTSAAISAMRPRVEQLVDWCIDRYVESGHMDMFHDLAKLVPAMVTMELIGLPPADAEIIADAVHVNAEDRLAFKPPWALLFKRMAEAIAQRREAPRDDLISYLLGADIGGRKLTDSELHELCFTMVIGGMATTTRLTLGALSYFAAHRGERDRVRQDRTLLPSAIEEFLRYYSPVPLLARTASRDVTLGGQDIRAGDRVVLGFAAANRDPRVFDEPDEIRIDRSPNRHLALGHGLHYCIGAQLGKMEAGIMIERVLDRMPDFMLADDHRRQQPAVADGDSPGEKPSPAWESRTGRRLPVIFTPAGRVGTDIGFSEFHAL
jgi:cytochrome P450